MQTNMPQAKASRSNMNHMGYYSNVKLPTHPESAQKSGEPARLQNAEDIKKGVEAAIAEAAMDKEDIAEFSNTEDGQNGYKANSAFASGVKTGSAFETRTSKPQDNSSELTKRLVAAAGQFEVRQITAEANTSLVKLRMYAGISTGKDKEIAEAYIKRLEKLLSRADRKIKDLNNEDIMKLEQARAKKKNQQKRAEEIKAELRKQKVLRKQREQNYLIEDMYERLGVNPDSESKLDSASEAEIAIQAEAMAEAESVAIGGADMGGAPEAALDVSVEVDSGGEAAAPEISIEA